MMFSWTRLDWYRPPAILPAALLCCTLLAVSPGCTPSRKHPYNDYDRRYEENQYRGDDYDRASYGGERPKSRTEEVFEPVTDDDGGLFNIIKDIVVLPFHVIGAVFDVLL